MPQCGIQTYNLDVNPGRNIPLLTDAGRFLFTGVVPYEPGPAS